MTQPFLKLENVTLNLNGHLLFDNTNWLWEQGQHWTVIGPNGSGKSLLAKAICRQIPLQKGRISYFFHENPDSSPLGEPFYSPGEIVTISPALHQNLMHQYGGYHQARWQSLEDSDIPAVNTFLSGKSIEHRSPYEVTPFKTPEAVYFSRREKALALLEIEYLLDRKIHQLSNGEARKVLIARALMQSPQLLILDDLYAGLDIHSRERLGRAIESLLQTGNPRILLITSRLEEIPAGITHILFITEGKIREQGPRDKTLQNPDTQRCLGETAGSGSGVQVPALLKFPDFQSQTAANEPLVEMKHTSVAYNGIQVLSDINWIMKPGERWAILGHNGAGKSTLLSLILADNPQSYANDIRLFGKARGSGESIWEIKKRIGWVAPELQIYYAGGFSCLEVVCSGFYDSIGLYRNCAPKQYEAAREWLTLAGISGLVDHPFDSLSLGEQRLTLLARALVKTPALLILDEPCQRLDDFHRRHILNLLDQLCRQTGIGMIYVTHYPDELPQGITHVLKLEKGQVIENTERSNL